MLPIQVKSGKSYRRHSALSGVLATPNYGIGRAVVLCEDNLSEDGGVAYRPVYMAAFIEEGGAGVTPGCPYAALWQDAGRHTPRSPGARHAVRLRTGTT